MSLKHDDEWVEKDDPLYGQPTHQAVNAREIMELYLWWTTLYPSVLIHMMPGVGLSTVIGVVNSMVANSSAARPRLNSRLLPAHLLTVFARLRLPMKPKTPR
jgi:hypothetical protein